MKRTLAASLLALSATLAAAPAMAQDVSVSVSVDYVTEYVFRGVTLAEDAIQPGVEVGIGDFYVGGWFSAAFGDTSIFSGDEFDLYAGYGIALSDTLALDVGATYYHYPQGPGGFFESDGGGVDGTYEVYGGLSFDTVLAPSVYAYYDLDLSNLTLEGSIGHSIPLADATSLDLGLTAGLVAADGDGDYEYGQASAALTHGFTDDVSVYASANFALASEDNFVDGDFDFANETLDIDVDDNTFFLAFGISAGF